MQNLNYNTLVKQHKYHRPLVFNMVLWSLSFVILLFIFSKGKTPIEADFIYTISFIIVVSIPVSINFYLLIPRFLKQEKYTAYIVLFILNLFGFAYIASRFFDVLLNSIFKDYFFVSYLSSGNIFLTFTIFLIATTLIKLAEDWFFYNTKQNEVLKLQNQQIQTQLSALRAQINPHFLFNSLNVIYAMALEKKENITSAIVELSDVLRYVIYDSNTERVSLKDEIKLLQNYIAFQKYRGQSQNAVDLHIEVENESFKIHPMLLLPLLENAYKYGFSGNDTAEKIIIKMIQNNSNFSFYIQNKNNKKQQSLDDHYSGVGLQNLENNLKLVYPNKHVFTIEDTEKTFTVSIKINNE